MIPIPSLFFLRSIKEEVPASSPRTISLCSPRTISLLCGLLLSLAMVSEMARSVRAQEASAAQARTRQAKPNLAIRNEFLQQFRAAIKEDPESGPALLEDYLAPRQGKQDPQLLIDISTKRV